MDPAIASPCWLPSARFYADTSRRRPLVDWARQAALPPKSHRWLPGRANRHGSPTRLCRHRVIAAAAAMLMSSPACARRQYFAPAPPGPRPRKARGQGKAITHARPGCCAIPTTVATSHRPLCTGRTQRIVEIASATAVW